MTPRQYDLLLTRSQKLAVELPMAMFVLLPLILLLVFSSVDFPGFPEDDRPPFFPIFPLIFFLGFAAFYGWSVLSLPYRISVTLDQQIVFKSILQSRSVRVSELYAIEPRSLSIHAGLSGYVLRYQSGKIRFPGQFTGMYMLLHELKQANPMFDIKGC